MNYKITRMKKDRSENRTLSKNKKKWLPLNSKQSPCIMTEREADEFIKEQPNNEYYFFKTQAKK